MYGLTLKIPIRALGAKVKKIKVKTTAKIRNLIEMAIISVTTSKMGTMSKIGAKTRKGHWTRRDNNKNKGVVHMSHQTIEIEDPVSKQ